MPTDKIQITRQEWENAKANVVKMHEIGRRFETENEDGSKSADASQNPNRDVVPTQAGDLPPPDRTQAQGAAITNWDVNAQDRDAKQDEQTQQDQDAQAQDRLQGEQPQSDQGQKSQPANPKPSGAPEQGNFPSRSAWGDEEE